MERVSSCASSNSYDDSVSAATHAVEIAQQLPARQKDVLAAAHQALGDVHSRGRHYALAHASHQRSIEIGDASGGGEVAARGRTVGQAAMNLAYAGVPVRALPYFERNAAESRASGRPISRFVAPAHGTALAWVGRAVEGAALHRESLMSDQARGDPSMPIALLSAAGSYLDAGDLSGAQTLLDEVDSRTVSATNLQARLNVLHGELALARGNAPYAIERLRAGIVTFEAATDVSAQLQRVLALVSLANAQRAMGDVTGATATARTALALISSLQPRLFEASMYAGLAELSLGEALLASGAHREARSSLERAVVQLEGSLGTDAPHLKKAQAALRRTLR